MTHPKKMICAHAGKYGHCDGCGSAIPHDRDKWCDGAVCEDDEGGEVRVCPCVEVEE